MIKDELISDESTTPSMLVSRSRSPLRNALLPSKLLLVLRASYRYQSAVKLAFSSASFYPTVAGEECRFISSGSDPEVSWQVFNFDVNAGEQISAEVNWTDPTAEVRVFQRDENKTLIAKDTNGGSPTTVLAVAVTSGRWSVAVKIVSGTVNYTVSFSSGLS